MKRNLRPRADLDDGDPPAQVGKVNEKIPRCYRCREQVPEASTLWTICEACKDLEYEDLKELAKRPAVKGNINEVPF